LLGFKLSHPLLELALTLLNLIELAAFQVPFGCFQAVAHAFQLLLELGNLLWGIRLGHRLERGPVTLLELRWNVDDVRHLVPRERRRVGARMHREVLGTP